MKCSDGFGTQRGLLLSVCWRRGRGGRTRRRRRVIERGSETLFWERQRLVFLGLLLSVRGRR